MTAYNVASLLNAPTGTTRMVEISETEPRFGPELPVRSPMQGNARFTRTQDGILVQGRVAATVEEVECSRCLMTFPAEVATQFEEEFIPCVNVVTGAPLPPPEDEALRIDDRHVLDLTETFRQYLLTAVPLKPVCSTACRGLCQTCGVELNTGGCECDQEVGARPFAALATLLMPDRVQSNRHR
ncbi:MAG: DUF177 domain-containing protein [Chloroflexi bacterium]|nr:DUF177 domain-containing protein [Chloroflexota bacterium]